jgi:hypothetical protein
MEEFKRDAVRMMRNRGTVAVNTFRAQQHRAPAARRDAQQEPSVAVDRSRYRPRRSGGRRSLLPAESRAGEAAPLCSETLALLRHFILSIRPKVRSIGERDARPLFARRVGAEFRSVA